MITLGTVVDFVFSCINTERNQATTERSNGRHIDSEAAYPGSWTIDAFNASVADMSANWATNLSWEILILKSFQTVKISLSFYNSWGLLLLRWSLDILNLSWHLLHLDHSWLLLLLLILHWLALHFIWKNKLYYLKV